MSDEPTRNPYVGLRPFFEEDSLFYFGRRVHTTAVLEALGDSRFLGIVGSSGCGKSSLIRAGVIPALKAGFLVQEQDRWSVVRMRPGTAPLSNLAAAICEAVESSDGSDSPDALLEAVRLDHEDAVLDYLRRGAEGTNVLLLVDQFEEVFSSWRDPDAPEPDDREGQIRVASRKAEATDFVDILLRLADQAEVPIYVVLTMRTDYLGDCEVFHGLPEALNRGRYLVPRLTPEQVRDAIVGPARLSGARIAPRLLDELLNQLGDRFDQLPVLQHALQRTWAEWDRRGRDGPIDLVHFRAVGGLEDALSNDAEDALAGFDEKVAAAVFKRLTTTDAEQRRIRSRARLSELAAVSGASKQTIEDLIERFRAGGRNFLFVSADGKPDDPVVDISHESLIRQWPKLRDWVDTECNARDRFRELQERGRRYERGEAAALRDPDLQLAVSWQERSRPSDAWAARYGGSLPLVNRYITESRTADRNRRRRLNALVAGGALAAVLIAVVFGILRRRALAAEVVAAEARIETLTGEIEALSTSNADLTDFIDVLNEKNIDLRFESANLDADIDSLTREIPFLRSDIGELETELLGLRNDSIARGIRMAEINEATNALADTLSRIRPVVEELERQEREQRTNFEVWLGEAKSLGLVAEVDRPQVDAVSALNVDSPPAPADLSARYWIVERLRVVVDSLRLENLSLREQIAILEVSNDSIAARIEEQRVERDSLARTVDALRADRERLEVEKADIQSYLEDLQTRIFAAELDLAQDSSEWRTLRGRELWLRAAIPRLAATNSTLLELLGRDAGAAPNHRFTSLVLGERDDSIAAGVLATTMFAMAPATATGPDDPRVISALRVALDRLGGVATTYLSAPPAATAVGVPPDGFSIVLATANGSFESIALQATLAPIENQETASTRREGATLSFSPDGQRIVVAGPRGLRLYEGPDRRPVTAQVPSVIADASSAAFLADGRLLIAGPNGAMAWTIGAATVVSAGFCTSPVTAVAAAANAPFAACATSDGVVEVWRSDTRQRVAILPHVCNPSRTDVVARNEACEVRFADLRFSDDGRRVAALDDDGVIRLWALNPATAGAQAGARATPAALVISGEPGRVPTSPFDPFPVDAAVSIAFTPDADLLVAVTAGGGLAIHVISPERLAAEICRRLPAGSAPSCPGRAP